MSGKVGKSSEHFRVTNMEVIKETCDDSPLLPVCMQSTPKRVFFSLTCRDFMAARVSIGDKPLFSARAIGIASNASAKARIAYCSRPGLCRC